MQKIEFFFVKEIGSATVFCGLQISAKAGNVKDSVDLVEVEQILVNRSL